VNDRGAVIGGADVADVGLTQLVCPQAGQQCGQHKCEIAFSPIGLML
jgi:hypothetical protein